MKIAIAAFLFAKGNVKVNHKKSSEKTELKCIENIFLVSITSYIDEIIEIESNTNHETISSVSRNI